MPKIKHHENHKIRIKVYSIMYNMYLVKDKQFFYS